MNTYIVTYLTRLENREELVQVLAGNLYEACKKVANSEGRPLLTKVSLSNEIDYVK